MSSTLETEHAFWRKIGKGELEPRALQLVLPDGAPIPLPVPVARGHWTPAAKSALAAIVSAAKTEKRPDAALPFRTLCAALQVHLPDAVLINDSMNQTWADRASVPPVFEIPLTVVDVDDQMRRAHEALGVWVSRRLLAFAERCGIHGDKVAELQGLASRKEAFSISMVDLTVPPNMLSGRDAFPAGRDFVLSCLASSMPGLEPFSGPGMGELHRVVRSDVRSNGIEFITWPRASGRILTSAVLTVSVETAPWTVSPIVRVEVSKRRWLKTLPRHFGTQRNLTGYALVRDRHVAVNMPISIRQGRTDDVDTPAFVLSLLNANRPEDQTIGLDKLIGRGVDEMIFVGVPYKTTYRGVVERGDSASGVSTLDLVEAFDCVAGCLATMGFVEASGSPLRPIKHYERYSLGALGPDHVVRAHDEWAARDDAAPTWDLKPTEGGRPDEASAKKLEQIRQAHDKRLNHAHGPGSVVTVRVFASVSEDWLAVRLVSRALYGDRVVLETTPLPPETHGPFRVGDGRKRQQRNLDKIGAWKHAATTFAADSQTQRRGEPRLALVMARKNWPVVRDGETVVLADDPVSKPAARTALAEYAGANTQFLIPAGKEGLDPSGKVFRGFILRVQAAMNDLLFGHLGLVAPLSPVLAKAFPSGNAPTCVVGITMVRKNRGARGGDPSSVLAAVRIGASVAMPKKQSDDPAPKLDETLIRLAWHEDAAPNVTAWMPYSEGLRRMAGFQLGSIGSDRSVKGRTTRTFVRTILDDLKAEGERPLVLVDATGLGGGIWPWLNDSGIREPLNFEGDPIDPAKAYPGFRLVRMRSWDIPRVVSVADTVFHALDEEGQVIPENEIVRFTPTMASNIVRLGQEDGGIPCYLVTMGYADINHQVARGTSNLAQESRLVRLDPVSSKNWPARVERRGTDIHEFRKLSEDQVGTKPYRKPEALDLAMPVLSPGDDPNLVAALVALLRSGAGHTDAKTFLPVPLSFERQLKNYMGRYTLDEGDIPDLPAEDMFEDEFEDDEI
jgi:hypothetical protein